jgi:hypothetical protein
MVIYSGLQNCGTLCHALSKLRKFECKIKSSTFLIILCRLDAYGWYSYIKVIRVHFLMMFAGMTLSFFYDVTDTGITSFICTALFVDMFHVGSWLEIGQSISFFCITSLLLVWSSGICAAGELMMEETIKSWKYRLKSD